MYAFAIAYSACPVASDGTAADADENRHTNLSG